MPRHTYTEEQLQRAVQESTSIRQVLQKLSIVPAGGNYRTVHKQIESLRLDTSHFTGQGHNKGKSFPKTPLTEYLNGRPVQSHKLRLRLLQEEVFQHVCSLCNLSQWQGKPIPLELDHIDGNHSNNSIDNLRLICPNCHAQTDTYRGKNKRKT